MQQPSSYTGYVYQRSQRIWEALCPELDICVADTSPGERTTLQRRRSPWWVKLHCWLLGNHWTFHLEE